MDKPAVPEDRWRLWAAFAILFAFAYLALSALGAAWVFPHRYAPAPTDFDTSFMGTLAANDATPLAIAAVSSTDDTVAGRPITVEELTFHSETSGGVDVRIFAALVRPRAMGPPAPGLVLVHGYGGSHNDSMRYARELAGDGYVAIAIDAPDSGRSTPYPRRTPENFVNATPDPKGAFFYHVAYAASRALSVLESRPYVDDARLGVLGASQGGVMSLYLAAKDPRVRAAVPIIAGGNVEDAFQAPSAVHALVPKDLGPTDPRAVAFRRHYDPLAYASEISVPTLYLAGTNDEFFPIGDLMQTYDAIPARKWLGLVPNHGHALYEGWNRTVVRFLDWAFRSGPALPDPAVLGVTSDLLGVHVTAASTSASEVRLLWRGSTAAEAWQGVRMDPVGTEYRATAGPPWPGRVSFYVSVVEGGTYTTATAVLEADAAGLTGPALMVVTATMTAYLLGLLGVAYRDRLVPLAAALLSTVGGAVAWVGVPGRTAWGVYEIADRTALGGGVLLPYLLWFSLLITVALLRPRKMVVLTWVPVIFTATVCGVLYALFGSAVIVAPSWGFLAILAAPLLVLAERRWRKAAPHVY